MNLQQRILLIVILFFCALAPANSQIIVNNGECSNRKDMSQDSVKLYFIFDQVDTIKEDLLLIYQNMGLERNGRTFSFMMLTDSVGFDVKINEGLRFFQWDEKDSIFSSEVIDYLKRQKINQFVFKYSYSNIKYLLLKIGLDIWFKNGEMEIQVIPFFNSYHGECKMD